MAKTKGMSEAWTYTRRTMLLGSSVLGSALFGGVTLPTPIGRSARLSWC